MANGKPAGSKLRLFIGKNRRLITVAAAVIAFVTYLAKEGVREHFKDLAAAVDSAENLFIITETMSPMPNVARELRSHQQNGLCGGRGD